MSMARIKAFGIAASLVLALASSAASAAVTYTVSGTFRTQSGGLYATLSGGSFSGSFTLADDYFPRPAENSAYLYDAPFSIDIFSASGTKVTTLANTPAQATYLQVANTYASTYGGLRLFFRVSSTDYLQLVVPMDFTGTGSINASNANYALVLGDDYAYLSSGTISAVQAASAVPEPASWAMAIAGFALAGGALRRRPKRARPAFA
jgi:hypothetical protein